MRRIFVGLLLALALAGCGHPPLRSLAASEPVLAITNVTLIDVSASDVEKARLPRRTILIRDGMITAVGRVGELPIPRTARRIDGRGKYLVPGLWDAHVHLGTFGRSALPLFVAEGVTSVRDMGGTPALLKQWRNDVEQGALTGPRILIAGRLLEGAWWLDRISEAARTNPVLTSFPFLEISPRERLASPSDAVRAVASITADGVDLVKFRNLRPEEFAAVAAEMKKTGLPLVGHSPRNMSPGAAAESGMATIEHMETVTLALGTRDDAARSQEFRRMAAAGSAIVASLITDVAYRQTPDERAYAVIADSSNRLDPRRRYLSDRALKAWKFGLDVKQLEAGDTTDHAALHQRQLRDLRLARAAGVPIIVGTDLTVSLIYPGSSVHEELAYLVERGGLSPFEALKGATFYPARATRQPRLGTIAPGMQADLLLLSADPIADIAATRRISAVILRGKSFEGSQLQALRLKSAEIASSPTP